MTHDEAVALILAREQKQRETAARVRQALHDNRLAHTPHIYVTK